MTFFFLSGWNINVSTGGPLRKFYDMAFFPRRVVVCIWGRCERASEWRDRERETETCGCVKCGFLFSCAVSTRPFVL